MRQTSQISAVLAALVALLGACGGDCHCPTAEVDGAEGTSGGEGPVVHLTTTPIPVPQPAVPRQELSDTLQQVWVRVEEVVADRVPDPPAEATDEAVQAWADGPFTEWVGRRFEAARGMRRLAQDMSDEHEHSVAEQAVSAALFGYMYEDFAAGAHGAPVPEHIANDPELLTIYVQALDHELMPVVERAFDAYMWCADHITAQLSDTPWANWGLYCYQRASEIDEIYAISMRRHFQAADMTHPASEEVPSDADGAEGEGEGEGEEVEEEAEPTSSLGPSGLRRS